MPFGGFLTAGLVVGGMGGQIAGGIIQGNAAQSIAQQQLAAQQAAQQQALGYAGKSISAAMPTMEELQALDQQLQAMSRTYTLQSAALNRDQSLLSSIDPAFVSAGQQAYQLMNGQNAPVLGPMQTQIETQRQQLQQTLQKEYGPGWADSSAGQQAMLNFNNQANLTMAQMQQSYTGQLLSAAGSYAPNLAGDVNSSGATMGGLASQYLGNLGNIQSRQMGAYGQAIQALIGTNPAQMAGANQISSLQQGQMFGNMSNSLAGAGATMGSQAIGQSMYFNNLSNFYQNNPGLMPGATMNSYSAGAGGSGGLTMPSGSYGWLGTKG